MTYGVSFGNFFEIFYRTSGIFFRNFCRFLQESYNNFSRNSLTIYTAFPCFSFYNEFHLNFLAVSVAIPHYSKNSSCSFFLEMPPEYVRPIYEQVPMANSKHTFSVTLLVTAPEIRSRSHPQLPSRILHTIH